MSCRRRGSTLKTTYSAPIHRRKWKKEGSLDQKCRVEKIHVHCRTRFGKSERGLLAALIRCNGCYRRGGCERRAQSGLELQASCLKQRWIAFLAQQAHSVAKVVVGTAG
jgi:hypothetical protein